jgi:hypothetical protein
MPRARLLPALLALPAVLLLSACGGGDGGTTTASPTAAAEDGGIRGGEQFRQIRECLTAAGISLPTPSGTRPSGTRPSGPPDGTPPSGGPRGGDGPGGGPGFGQLLDDPQAQAALDACGIAVPTGRPSDAPQPSSTASPSA